MPKFNTSFDLNVRDIELIESALAHRKKELSLKRLALLSSTTGVDSDEVAQLDTLLSDTHNLMGRLHNQKVFYRPEKIKATPYISG